MKKETVDKVLQLTGAQSVEGFDLVQKLWNDYGNLLRVRLKGGAYSSVILKHILIPGVSDQSHPRGFGGSFSRDRKVRSYQVETVWYDSFNDINSKTKGARTAKYLGGFQKQGEFFLVLEDLNAAGFEHRLASADVTCARSVLSWLAAFHAKFLNQKPTGLWTTGTYWQLDTRPSEWAKMADGRLKRYAGLIHEKLENAQYKTLVHGDAKIANFCFSDDLSRVAAVDFQYVGGGVGIKDVAYFIGSCFSEGECERYEAELLNFYFSELRSHLGPETVDGVALEKEWRELFYFAWADFHRFLKGWSPDHKKVHRYSEAMTKRALDNLASELLDVAETACKKAGDEVMKHWKKDFTQSEKEGATASSRLVTEVDYKSQAILLSALASSRQAFNLGLLAEEEQDDGSRHEKRYFWTVDPLDGTLPFSEGRSGFAITVALVSQEGETLLGVVYDPIAANLFSAAFQQGLRKNGEPLRGPNKSKADHPMILFADRSLKDSPHFGRLLESFDVRFDGGAVMNVINVLSKPNACYFKYPKKEKGGCAVWDLAAVSLMVKEVGGDMTSFDGEPLCFNKADSVNYNEEGLLVTSHPEDQKKLTNLIPR